MSARGGDHVTPIDADRQQSLEIFIEELAFGTSSVFAGKRPIARGGRESPRSLPRWRLRVTPSLPTSAPETAS
jgi:hypothetical protein